MWYGIISSSLSTRNGMFNSQAFQSWFIVVLGGFVFALLFMLVGMMSGLVIDGELHMTRMAVSLGLLAFVGYIGVASAVRMRKQQ